MTLASAGNPLALPPVPIFGTTEPAADKLSLASAAFNSLACPGTAPPANVYSGTLNRQ